MLHRKSVSHTGNDRPLLSAFSQVARLKLVAPNLLKLVPPVIQFDKCARKYETLKDDVKWSGKPEQLWDFVKKL